MTPTSRSTSRAKRASVGAAPAPVRALAAGQIEKGLVDRQRLDERRQALHPLANLAADARVFGHVRLDDDRLRTQRKRPCRRHRRADAEGAGDVAAGGDDAAAPAAADDDRLVGEGRVVALLDRGVEGVAVDMGDRQVVGMARAQDARRPAVRATGGVVAHDAELHKTIAAKARTARRRLAGAQGSNDGGAPPRLSLARTMAAGSSPRLAAKATSRRSSATT